MKLLRKFIRRVSNKDSYERFLSRLGARFIRLKLIPNPVLIMTLLVRNEEDILEKNLIFHKAMGVDGFIVTDNNSTDGTPKIIEKYVEKGWIKEVISEKGNNYAQSQWVNKMILVARDKYHADWIINADADELWYHPSGNLKNELSQSKANVIYCPLLNVIPEEGKPLEKWDHVVINPLESPQSMGLSRYSLFVPQIAKVAHRSDGYRSIYVGNHGVKMSFEKIQQKSGILIYHYPIRSLEHFTRKVSVGGAAMVNNPDNKIGVHWRELYQIYLLGKLDQEYKKVVGREQFDVLLERGVIKKDSVFSNSLDKVFI